MRQQIDCAVLALTAHQHWLPKVLKAAEPALSRIRIHTLDWEAGHHLEADSDLSVSLPIATIAQSAVALRRYDIALLPVSMNTLAWTRQALGAIPRGPFIPVMGIFKDLRSAAIQDLLELGMRDFVRTPLCPDELRARILSTVTTVPRPGSLREPEPGYGQASWLLKDGLSVTGAGVLGHVLPTIAPKSVKARQSSSRRSKSVRKSMLEAKDGSQSSHLPFNALDVSVSQPMSFKAAKASLVEEFERHYITSALERNEGNIAMAARYADKHRRAFWALMRKYEIDASDFRQQSTEGYNGGTTNMSVPPKWALHAISKECCVSCALKK